MTVLERNRKGGYAACRIPALVRTDEGALVAAYECRRASDADWAEIDVKIIRSEDGGKSWQTVALFAGDGRTQNNPVLFAEGTRVLLLFCKSYAELWLSASCDGGRSFAPPRAVTVEGDGFFWNARAIGPGHGVCHGGRLIVPVWFAYHREDPHAHRPSFVATLYSEDGGERWRVGERLDCAALVNPSECALAKTEDGRVMISIRNENEEHLRALATSKSGIDGWEKPRLCPLLPDPVCEGSMSEAGGVIYHVNCTSQAERRELAVKASRDGFSSVCRTYPVDELGGYADIATDGKSLFVLYEKNVLSEDGALCFARIAL